MSPQTQPTNNSFKKLVRGIFGTIDLIIGLSILIILLPPILLAMQIHRIKQWSRYDED